MIRTLSLILLIITLAIQVQAAAPDQEYQAVRSKLMKDFQAQGNMLVHCSGVTFFPNGNWVSPDGKSAGKLSARGRESVRNILQVIQDPERKLRIPREYWEMRNQDQPGDFWTDGISWYLLDGPSWHYIDPTE